MQPDIRDYSALPWIHDAFRARVRDHGDAVALRDDGTWITYRELGARVRRLAGVLRAHGVRPGDVVGVALERSADLVTALLAALTAGAAYLPLDSSYPDERVRFMIEDSRAALVLARPGSAADFSVTAVLPIDGTLAGPDDETEALVTGASTAYVIYTSGSTGRPKGVMVTHAGLRNRIAWMQQLYALRPADRVLQKTPSSFDVSVWEFFWPLTEGACLVLARPGGHWDLDYLARTIRDEGVSVVHFVPSMLRLFLAEPAAAGCTSLRLMVCSGEALTPDLADAVLRTLPCRLDNLYGPTEATVDVTWWRCEPGIPGVPIGHAVPNTAVRVLDGHGAEVPPGTVGEIHLGGVQVATGYLHRPALTAERFVPDPFAEPGARLYRTGDLGTRRPDCAIEYVGRIDQQIKLYGNRIELGEIETGLASHPSVRAAVVTVTGGAAPSLAARVVPAGRAPDPADLLAYLRQRLPAYMIPARLDFVDQLPLTPSGKVDRRPPDDDVAAMRRTLSWQGDDEIMVLVPAPSLTGLERFLGGRVVARALADLADAVSAATTLWADRDTLGALVESGWPGDPALRVVCAGPPPSPDLTRRLCALVRVAWSVPGPGTGSWTPTRLTSRERPATAAPAAVPAAAVPVQAPAAPGTGGHGRWLLRRPDPAAEARLFLFPYSGCGASMYHRWPRRIGGIEFCVIQPPGRENRIREPHYGTYERLAAGLAEYLPPFLDRPYGIFGHCGGALAATELVHQVAAAGLPAPARLFASGQVAPQDGPFGRFLDLGPEELTEELRRLITDLGGTPTPKHLAHSTDLLCRDLDAARQYRVTEPRRLTCAVTVIGWSQDVEVPPERLDGWNQISPEPRHVVLDGGHFAFLNAPDQLLAELARGMGGQ